jgi:thymidylate synthase
MMLIQRSGDMLTASGAGGVNEIQYAALLIMIAKATGYTPGVFTHIVANEQIYDRHMDAANELLKRTKDLERDEESVYKYKFDNVEMKFNPKSNDFYDFSIDDFELVNYNPIKPQLTLELGI